MMKKSPHYQSPFKDEKRAENEKLPTIGLSRGIVFSLFRAGMNTMEIAEFHGITEAEAYNKLSLARGSHA